MITFDQIVPLTLEVLDLHQNTVRQLEWLIINRDLNGRVCLIVPEETRKNEILQTEIKNLYRTLSENLVPHAYPIERGILYETSLLDACQGASHYALSGFDTVWLVDRLATEANWARIAPEVEGVPRIVFFSIKGGVGRSTALAATAWHLAQAGKRVLVLDLDLESPGLSSALLPSALQPKYGITDWLVEDLVNNGDIIFDSMVAASNLSHDGEIHVVPAHGAEHGEYIAKLGRVWMPKTLSNGIRETWSFRLVRLLQNLEERIQPDIVLIDSRSGIDEISSACIIDIGATLILLFALEGNQTWDGHRMLFEQWQRANVAESIRERLQVVGAIVPELDRIDYLTNLREHSYEVFVETLYDEIAPVKLGVGRALDGTWKVGELNEGWSFDEADPGAPHHPWAVNWHRSFAGLRSLQGRLAVIDAQEVQSVFGSLIEGITSIMNAEKAS